MSRALLRVICAALALAIAVSCQEPPKEDEALKVMEELLDRGVQMASGTEGLAVRAWQLSRIAAQTGRDVSPLMDEAVAAAEAVRSEENLNYAQALRLQAQGWPPFMVQRAEEVAHRLERASSRAWPLRAVAAELKPFHRKRASELLLRAASVAEEMEDPEYRDMELQAIASEMARINKVRGVRIASRIETPYHRAWALRVIGELKGDLKLLDQALRAARQVQPPELEGLSEGHTKRKRAQHLHRKAVMLARIALALDEAGAKRDQVLDAADAAVEVAESIEVPDVQAYAYSSTAAILAPVDVPTAAYIASMITEEYPEAAVAARMAIAREMSRGAALEELRAVREIAHAMDDAYERQKTLGQVVSALAGLDPEEALRYLNGRLQFPFARSEPLKELLVERLLQDEEAALRLLERAPFLRSEVYADAAEAVSGEDAKAARRYFARALSAAEETGSPYLLWSVAARWSAHEPDRLFELLPALTASHPRHSAAAALGLALALKDEGHGGKALEAYRLALSHALGIEEPFLRSEVLKDLSRAGRPIDEATSVEAFQAALKAARSLGAPPAQ